MFTMKILFKKWDFWYWLAFIVFLIWKTSMASELYTTNTFGYESFGWVLFLELLFYVVPVVLIWLIIKVIQKLLEKRK